VVPPGRSALSFRPRIVALTPERELGWLGRLVLPGLFDGGHAFRLSAEGPGCRFDHGERFTGILVPIAGAGLAATRLGFERMNEALKARAEA
jgi:hypothetical protein